MWMLQGDYSFDTRDFLRGPLKWLFHDDNNKDNNNNNDTCAVVLLSFANMEMCAWLIFSPTGSRAGRQGFEIWLEMMYYAYEKTW